MRPPWTASRLVRRPRALPSFVCRRCLFRDFASTAAVAPRAPPPASGFTALGSRRLISVSGPDAAKYLQGVVTANVLGAGKTPRTSGLYTAFLSAQGRVLFDVFIYPGLGPDTAADGAESFLIEVDAAEAELLARHIKRYKLRAKFNLRLLDTEEAMVWQAWDNSRPLDSGLPALAADRAGSLGSPRVLLRDPRSPTLGSRLITAGAGDAAATSRISSLLELEPTAEPNYRVRRYLSGVAEGQSELLREHALPAESNMDLCGAVDFRKGCYVGQELTIRTRHRGVVRKRVLPCMLYGEDRATPPDRLEYLPYSPSAQPEKENASRETDKLSTPTTPLPADEIPCETSIGRVSKRGRSAGKWLAGTGNIGLALCRLEIMTDLPPPPGEAAPYSPGDEFVMVASQPGAHGDGEADRAVKVKAFVPDWLRRRLADQAEAAGRGH